VSDLNHVLVLLAVGVSGGLLARRLRLPGGPMVGAMLATGLVSLAAADSSPLPEGIRSFAMLLLGTSIGASLERSAVVRLRRVLPTALLAILTLIAVGFALGWTLYRFAGGRILLVTAMLSTMPGGASGLAAAAYDLGAEPELVASFHLVRIILVFSALPAALQWLLHAHRSRQPRKPQA